MNRCFSFISNSFLFLSTVFHNCSRTHKQDVAGMECYSRRFQRVPDYQASDIHALWFYDNRILTFGGFSSQHLNLLYLDISFNRLEVLAKGAFENIPNLRYLDLSDNPINIPSLDGRLFEPLPNLVHLDLRNALYENAAKCIQSSNRL